MDLSIVVPVYNEEENIPLLYDALITVMTPLSITWEAVLVDDGSRDQSARLLEDLAQKYPEHFRAVLLRRNFGPVSYTHLTLPTLYSV